MGWNYLSIPKLQRLHRWSLGMDKQFHPTLSDGCNYLSMLEFKLNDVSKMGHWCGVSYLGHHGFGQCLAACWMPCHYLNQWRLIVKLDLKKQTSQATFGLKYVCSLEKVYYHFLQNGGHFLYLHMLTSLVLKLADSGKTKSISRLLIDLNM